MSVSDSGAAFMRRLAQMRGSKDRTAFEDVLVRIRDAAPGLICPACNGTVNGCAVCSDRGLVCPTCRGARNVLHVKGDLAKARSFGGPPTLPLVRCPTCTRAGADRVEVHLLGETIAISHAIVASGVALTDDERAEIETVMHASGVLVTEDGEILDDDDDGYTPF